MIIHDIHDMYTEGTECKTCLPVAIGTRKQIT